MIPSIDYWILQTLALMITALIVPGLKVHGPLSALAGVLALGYLNSTIWDAALFAKLPDAFSIHALLVFAANGAVFWLFVKFMPGIEIRGVMPALFAPLVFSIVSLAMNRYGRGIDWLKIGQAVLGAIAALKERLVVPQGGKILDLHLQMLLSAAEQFRA